MSTADVKTADQFVGKHIVRFWPKGKYPKVSYRIVSGWGRVDRVTRPGTYACEVYDIESPHEGRMEALDDGWIRANCVVFDGYRELRNWYLGQYLPVLKHDMERVFEEANMSDAERCLAAGWSLEENLERGREAQQTIDAHRKAANETNDADGAAQVRGLRVSQQPRSR
jgi:hypothetical protein